MDATDQQIRELIRKGGGADLELIEGDIFRMVVSVPEFGANPAEVPQIVSATQPPGQVTGQVTGQVLSLLKVALVERSRKELMEAVGLTGRDNFEKLYLRPALDAELIEMTISAKPNSRFQKYRLTEKGKKMVTGRES
ncbi:MAG: transcriptional regulator [Pseudomonadota bacterium]